MTSAPECYQAQFWYRAGLGAAIPPAASHLADLKDSAKLLAAREAAKSENRALMADMKEWLLRCAFLSAG